MINNLKNNKILWLITGILALFTSIVGVTHIGIYAKVVSPELIPGVFSQDLITVLASITLPLFTFVIKEKDVKKQIIIYGILGYLFYAYGIYVIERTYNLFYLIYMAIFTLSFWSLIFGIANIKREVLKGIMLPSNFIRRLSAGGALLQPLIFYPLWIGSLIPLMQTGKQIDSLYSIYILDLCFIMPAFIVLAVMTLKKHPLGLLLSPAIFILGFILIFSLTIGELVKPEFSKSINAANLLQSGSCQHCF